MKKLLPLLLILITGCVQSGFIRPNPNDYLINVPGLSVAETKSFNEAESIGFNKSEVIIYYSAFNNEISNYVVRFVIGYNQTDYFNGFNKTTLNGKEVYHYINVSEQYTWLFNNGLIIVEGTYADYGSIEYDAAILLNLTLSYLDRFKP